MNAPCLTRAEASRQNGALSHGPVTVDGRLRASRNALKHGLTSTRPMLLRSEDPAEFEALCQEVTGSLHLQGDLEERAGLSAAWALWLVRRADRLMAQFLDASGQRAEAPVDAGTAIAEVRHLAATFRSLDRHRARLYRDFERALDGLLDLVEQRQAESEAAVHAVDAGIQNEPEPLPARPPSRSSAAPLPLLNRQQRRALEREQRREAGKH